MDIRSVPRRDGIGRQAFQSEFFAPKQPVVVTTLTQDWPAVRHWSPEYFKRKAGSKVVPLYNSRPARGREHQHGAETHLPLAEYIERLEAGERDLRMFFWQIMKEVPELADDFEYPDLGMKWFKRLPVLFFAGQGATVNLHFDIDLADLLLCHFGGPKTIYLFAPDQRRNLYHIPFSFSTVFDINPANPDFERFPKLREVKGLKTTLQHGEALYIPSGWWHYVIYEEISLSMTLRAMPHNWKNRAKLFQNIALIRTVDTLGRKLFADRWIERNLKAAFR